MMCGHGANPIFFNKKIKIERPEHSLTPHPPLPPPTSDNTLFYLIFQYSTYIFQTTEKEVRLSYNYNFKFFVNAN